MKAILFILNLLIVPFCVSGQENDSVVPVRHKEGMRQFYTWANEYLSAKDSLQGCNPCKVTISALVNPQGNFDSLWVSDPVNAALDANAMRVLKASEGQWLPCLQNDTAVTAELQVPFDFKGKHGFDPTIQDTGVHVLNGIVYRDAGFKGGKRAMIKYIGDRIKYPQGCREFSIQGEVVVAFVVDQKGLVKNAYVKKSVHPDLDKEAMRVVQATSGYFNPRTVNGIPHESPYEIPINFTLSRKK